MIKRAKKSGLPWVWYTLKKEKNGWQQAYFIELARMMKGINITTGEGIVEFVTREGGIGTVVNDNANTVVELFYPEDDANLAELREALH